jgi:Flp pilus assembly CpaE family ATPase
MMLDDIPRNTIEDVVGNAGHIDAELMDSVLAVHPKGVRYLASPSHDFDARPMTRSFANEVMGLVGETSDILVVDTGEGAPLASEAAYLKADVVLVLTTRDVVRLDATRRFIVRLNELGVPSEAVKVFVNQNELGKEVSDHEIEVILEHGLDGFLPNEPEAAPFSINSGKPLVLNDAKRTYSVVVGKIADLAISRWSEPEPSRGEPGAAGGKRGLGALFRRG